MILIGIDPGPTHSGVVWLKTKTMEVDRHGLLDNHEILPHLRLVSGQPLAIEIMQPMGMAVGQETFDTQLWAGRFIEAHSRGACNDVYPIGRREVKLHLCGDCRAKDPNVRRATLDRFAKTGGGKTPEKGTKKQPGPLYGIGDNDVWSALAIAVTIKETKLT